MKWRASEKQRAVAALQQMAGVHQNEVIPYAAPPAYRQPVVYQQIVTVQQTSKAWKAAIALGVLILMAGVVGVFVAMNDPSLQVVGLAGGAACVLGIIITIIAKIGAWWCHG
jgi:hypothetical protein